jgi:multicomponent Na+:H+ antiporter subunit G
VVVTWLSGGLIVAGGFFFVAGLAGLLRFPDVYARIHAVTKADTLGLGLVAVGVALTQPSLVHGVRIVFIWALVAFASGAAGHLLCRTAWLEELDRGTRTLP